MIEEYYLDRGERQKEGSIFGGLHEVFWTCLWAKYHNSHMYLMTDYEIYDPFHPSVYVLASVFTCLVAWLINSLLVYVLYAGSAYLLWMNFIIMFCWILVIILCIFVFPCLWFSSCLAHECIPCLSPNLQPRKNFRNPKT